MTTREIGLLGKSIVDQQMRYEVMPIEKVAETLNCSIRWVMSHLEDIPHGTFNKRPVFFRGDIVSLIRR